MDAVLTVDPSSLYRSPAGYEAMRDRYETTLARYRPAISATWVSTSFGATHVLVAGPADAPPIVLVHGANGNALMWVEQILGLSRDHRVYAPDTIGAFGMSAPTRPSFAGPGYGRWLLEVLDGLELGAPALAGISAGGWVVLKLATVAAERIRCAALISTCGFYSIRPPLTMRTLQALAVAIPAMLRPNDVRAQRFARAFTSLVSAAGRAEEDGGLFYLIIRHFHSQPAPPGLPSSELAKMTAPTLVLMGEKEFFLRPERVIARARATIPGFRGGEILSGVGHAMIQEDPARVNERMRAFYLTGQ